MAKLREWEEKENKKKILQKEWKNNISYINNVFTTKITNHYLHQHHFSYGTLLHQCLIKPIVSKKNV